MIKKHLLTCSVTLVLMIIFKLSFGSKASPRMPRENHRIPSLIASKDGPSTPLNFADETLPLSNNKVRQKMKRSLRAHRFGYVQARLLQRKARKMFPVIEPILMAYGIPDDFKFIPLVESGFGEGKSSRGAYGPWQFMAGTARNYGLVVNQRRDDRVNIKKSTIAACKYLVELHNEFKSWTLVAAAYNTGSAKLTHLIRKQSQGNYYRIHMNHETGTYLYSLIAMKELINKPDHDVNHVQEPVYAMTVGYNDDFLALN